MREFIQGKLEEIENIEVTPEMPDDILEEETTYFSFTTQEDYQDSDLDKNYTMRVSIIGYVKRKELSEENTLSIIDKARYDIQKKLKEINFKTSYNDVSVDNGVRKIRVTGYGIYNQINNTFIV